MRTERRRLADLVSWERNPRSISRKAMAGLKASIQRFGVVQNIIVNERTGRIVGGHQRAKAMAEVGLTETDVVIVDLSPDDEKALNVALNNPHTAGEFTDGLSAILDELVAYDSDLFTALRLDELQIPVAPGGEPGEDDSAEELTQAVSEPGDIWTIGPHRVMCGDSTDTDNVGRLLQDKKPLIMITDPPYGVNYDPKWRATTTRSDQKWFGARAVGQVKNDDRVDWKAAFELFPGSVMYVWHASWFTHDVAQSIIDCNFDLRSLIVWAKQHFAISRGHYHYQHELCWYGIRQKSTAHWTGDRKQTTLWQIANRSPFGGEVEDTSTNHGTQKPVECMRRPMANHGEPGDLVYDPFLGVATTVVAAHQTDRACYGMEIDPSYVDTSIVRIQNITNLVAKREDGQTFNALMEKKS